MAVLTVLLALAALVYLQGLLYRKRWDKHIGLSLSFSQPQATEGDRLLLTEVITNRKFLPLPFLAVKFQVSRHLVFDDQLNMHVSDDTYRNDLFNLLMFQRITRKLPFACAKRGIYTVKSAELQSADILARHRYTLPAACNAVLKVYPRILDTDEFLLTEHKQFLGDILTKRFIQPDPFTFRGIREYRSGDSLRTVNFNATARTGALMVNVYDYTSSREVVLLLNVEPYSAYPREELYEQAIRLTATLAAYYLENAVPVSLVSNAMTGVGAGGSKFERSDEQRSGRWYATGGTQSERRDGAQAQRKTDRPARAFSTGLTVESGAGHSHLDTLNEAFAHIDLSLGAAETGVEMLEKMRLVQDVNRAAGREPAYVLISTYHEKELRQSFEGLSASGADALWIIPAYRDMDVTAPLSQRVVRADLG